MSRLAAVSSSGLSNVTLRKPRHSAWTFAETCSARLLAPPAGTTAKIRFGSPSGTSAAAGSTGSPFPSATAATATWHNRDINLLAVHRSAVRREAAMNSWTPPNVSMTYPSAMDPPSRWHFSTQTPKYDHRSSGNISTRP